MLKRKTQAISTPTWLTTTAADDPLAQHETPTMTPKSVPWSSRVVAGTGRYDKAVE
ncbi:MAG: hypothetical protein ACJAZO_004819 [Myxococcota bacterium]|jgi:hypothetical protein